MRPATPRNILLFLLIFLGLGAIGGGGLLIISPYGKLIGMPLTALGSAPFLDFFWPGIILFFVLGVAPILLIVALLKKPESKLAESLNIFKKMHWVWTFTIYIAIVLLIWILTEMWFEQTVQVLHIVYICLAFGIGFFTLLPKVRSLYSK